MRCPASAALPQVLEIAGAAADRGTGAHKFLERYPDIGREAALEDLTGDALALCEVIDLEALGVDPAAMAREVSFAINCNTGEAREIGRNLDRKYAPLIQPEEIALTLDVVGEAGSTVYVGDYKTGRAKLESAAEHWQIRAGCYAAAISYDKDAALGELIRISDDGGAWRTSATFDGFTLDGFAAELKTMWITYKQTERLLAEDPAAAVQVTKGSHCRYCPAFTACPAQVSLALKLRDPEALEVGGTILSLEHAAGIWDKIKAAELVIKSAKSAVIAMASHEPIPLNNGKILGKVEKKGNRKLDGEKLHGIASAMWSRDVADQMVSLSSTQSKIREALKPATAKGKLSAAVRELLGQVEAVGGVTRKPTTSIEEYDPRPDK